VDSNYTYLDTSSQTVLIEQITEMEESKDWIDVSTSINYKVPVENNVESSETDIVMKETHLMRIDKKTTWLHSLQITIEHLVIEAPVKTAISYSVKNHSSRH